MSKYKTTRATKIKEDPDASTKSKTNSSTVPCALRKIFYISQHMLQDDTEKLNLERFYHPGKGKMALFITKDEKHIMEILEFAEPRRSWLIDSDVCSNGHIYLTTPIDVTFLALHHLRKHCMKRALALDSIHDEDDVSVAKILNNYVDPLNLNCVADVKTAGDMTFYKYNHDKAMAWLALKVKRIAKTLKTSGIYCGNSAVSQNFARSEKSVDETAQETDYLRMACDYVGGYIALELHEELTKYLEIPSEIQAITEEKKTSVNKRKSGDKLTAAGNKKQKLENGAAAKLKNSKILDDSQDDEDNKDVDHDKDEEVENKINTSVKEEIKSPKSIGATPLKERPMSAKEKSLAKSAKGTKSIASFFMKKTA